MLGGGGERPCAGSNQLRASAGQPQMNDAAAAFTMNAAALMLAGRRDMAARARNIHGITVGNAAVRIKGDYDRYGAFVERLGIVGE
jgi:hypothetical protein